MPTGLFKWSRTSIGATIFLPRDTSCKHDYEQAANALRRARRFLQTILL